MGSRAPAPGHRRPQRRRPYRACREGRRPRPCRDRRRFRRHPLHADRARRRRRLSHPVRRADPPRLDRRQPRQARRRQHPARAAPRRSGRGVDEERAGRAGRRSTRGQMSEPPLRAAIIPVTPLQQNCTLLWCTADDARRRSSIPAATCRGSRPRRAQARRHDREDPADPRPYRPLRISAGMLAEELGVEIEGPHEADLYWIDRLQEDGARYGITGRPFEPDALARRRRPGDRRQAHLRRPPLPRPHARPRRLPPSGIEAGDGRRRAVPGLGRPLGLPARQPAAADPLDHRHACGRWATKPPSSPATGRCRPSATSGGPIPYVGDAALAA